MIIRSTLIYVFHCVPVGLLTATIYLRRKVNESEDISFTSEVTFPTEQLILNDLPLHLVKFANLLRITDLFYNHGIICIKFTLTL